MAERMRRPVSITEVLSESAGRSGMADKFRRYGLWNRWPELVGSEVASHSQPARWQGNTLVVRVEHPAWIQELTFLKPQMIASIKEKLPRTPIKEIRFEVGKLVARNEDGEEVEKVEIRELTADEREFVEQATGEISDPDIREAAEKAMSKGMARKRS
jgi:predicted nucleic acid-binding Zn ribbon protein